MRWLIGNEIRALPDQPTLSCDCFGLASVIPLRGTISALRAVDICEPQLADDEAPKPFRFRGFIYPGSYLLSRDLSSDKTPDGCKGG